MKHTGTGNASRQEPDVSDLLDMSMNSNQKAFLILSATTGSLLPRRKRTGSLLLTTLHAPELLMKSQKRMRVTFSLRLSLMNLMSER